VIAVVGVSALLAVVVFLTNLFVARGQARRLERRASDALEDGASTRPDSSG
jgi:hypothetical protein